MTDPAAPCILVFDSGVGGLSVARCIHEALPGAELVYLADNAGFPYGDQPEPVVIERCTTLIRRTLEEIPCDVVVVACNTASTVVLPRLRALIDVPVVGVVPAIKPAAGRSANRRIGVLATPATVRRPYLDRLIDEFAGDCQVVRVGHPALVCWAEQLVRGIPVPEAELGDALAPLKRSGVDTVVLGCTHYPLLLDALKAVLPDIRHWVDSGDAIARRVQFLLGETGRDLETIAGGEHLEPVRAVLLSGEVPHGLAEFMASLGLAVRRIDGRWGGLADPVTATGSA
ncbi:glutamate racemase [Marinobacter sp. DUT-1]|uniref:glutamate racemase n=1 Tax=Marinobacter sp. DUT-1 TaxID=3412037 RepID=UPI003D1838E8